MDTRATTWDAFANRWGGPLNFLMGGECVPFSFDFPPISEIVDEMRNDDKVQIGTGQKGKRLVNSDVRDAFRQLPIDEAMDRPFSIAHFKLSVFDYPGGFLHGFKEAVLDPWEAGLTAAGFTWDRCYPIIFISGKGCATNYHMDFSHVMAWQITGTKTFCGLRDPDRWADKEARLSYQPFTIDKPVEMTEADALCFTMPPGEALWNVLLTPHWVDAGEEVAMSVNLSHGGLRLHGELSPNEAELEAYRQASGNSLGKNSSSY